MTILGLEFSYLFYSLLVAIPLIYWYFTRNYNYWKERGLEGPNPILGFGNIFATLFTSMPIKELEWFEKYGKLYGIFKGNNPVLTVADPILIKQILVKDFNLFVNRRRIRTDHQIINKNLFFATNDDWKRLRSIASPTFTSGKMKQMFPLIEECLTNFLDHLETFAIKEQDINIREMFGNFTMDVIAKCAFATTINTHKDPNNPFVINASNIFNYNPWRVIPALLFPKFLLKLLNIKSQFNEGSNQFFFNLTQHIIRERKNKDIKYNDFLQLLMDSENNSESISSENDINESLHLNEREEDLAERKKSLNINITNKKLTENEILATAWIFFIAGYETTAATLAYCIYELALNTQLQQKLYNEVKNANDFNGDINYEILSKMSYLDAVISETLRIYPPVLRLDRLVSSDYKLGETGLTLSKGQLVEIPVYAIHHSEEFYPNAHQFIPERFLPENRENLVPYTYLPFGAGPRNCVGMRFGLMEAKITLAQLIMRYQFNRCHKTDIPVKFQTVTRMCRSNNIFVNIKKRTDI